MIEHNRKTAIKKAYFTLAIAVAAISASPIITKFATAPSLTTSAFRLLFATALTALISWKTLKNTLRFKSYTVGTWLWMSLSGVALALHFWAWIESLQFTSVANSTLLVCTHPIIILPLSTLIFKEPLKFRKVVGIFITLIGTVMLSGVYGFSGLTQGLYGNVLALIGAFFVAIYLLIGKSIRNHVDNQTYTFVVYASATLTLWALQLGSGLGFSTLTTTDYLVFIALAIIPTLLGHTLFNKVLGTLSATTVSIATLGEPILASIYAYFLFQESLTTMQVLADFSVLAGIILSEMPVSKGKQKKGQSIEI